MSHKLWTLFIRFLSPLVVVMYLDNVTDAMLKGLNQQVYSMRYNIIDSAVSVALIYTVLPRYGVNGYIAIIFITELLNAFLSINRLMAVAKIRLSVIRNIFLPMCLVLASAYFVRICLIVRLGYVPDSPGLLAFSVGLVVGIYALLAMIFCKKKEF